MAKKEGSGSDAELKLKVGPVFKSTARLKADGRNSRRLFRVVTLAIAIGGSIGTVVALTWAGFPLIAVGLAALGVLAVGVCCVFQN